MDSVPKLNSNRIQFNYERLNLSIDYALTICGSHLSNQYDESFSIVGNKIDDAIRGIGAWDSSGRNIYSAFLSVASLHLDHYLITEIALKRIYEMTNGLCAIEFMIYSVNPFIHLIQAVAKILDTTLTIKILFLTQATERCEKFRMLKYWF